MDGPGDLPGTQDHGSACWSVLGGFYEGELIGPAYGATFVLAKTEDVADEYPEEEDNWVAAAEWGDMLGVDIISSSLAYYRWYTVEDMDGDTAVTTIGADIAASRGILVVNGAGNMGDSDWYIVCAPADGDSIIAVGAVDANNELAGFSSHGPTADGRTKPEVVARGLGVVCACNYTHDPLDDEFATNSGTSLSCPLVAGSAALLIEAAPSWPPMMVREALMMTADNADNPDNDRGWGRIDVSAAIDVALTSDAAPIAQQVFDARLHVRPNPVRAGTRFVVAMPAQVRQQGPVSLGIFDIAGRRVWSSDALGEATVVDWNARTNDGSLVPPGIYLARLHAGEWQATAKVVVGP
jgi:subtilisin family serine protease